MCAVEIVFLGVLRYIFFNEEDSVKIDISYKKKADGTNQHLLLLDEHLLNATYLATTFIMFYLAPPWMSVIFHFIICRGCLYGTLHLVLFIACTQKPKTA